MLIEKAVIFLYLGGLSCVWPFLTLHLLHIGLSIDVIAFINMALAFTSFFGIPLGGALINKYGRSRYIMVGCLVVCAAAFDLLYLISPQLPKVLSPRKLQMTCDQYGANITLPLCDLGANCSNVIMDDHWLHFRINNCTCLDEVPEFSSYLKQRHHLVCFEGEHFNYCEDLHKLQSYDDLLVEVLSDTAVPMEYACSMRLERTVVQNLRSNNLYCLGCAMDCLISSEPASPAETLHAAGKSIPNSWLVRYTVIRAVAETAAVGGLFALSGTLGEADLVGVTGAAIFSPIAGALADWAGGIDLETFSPCFTIFSLLILCAAAVAMAIPDAQPLSPESVWWTMCVLTQESREFLWMVIATLVLGILWGFLDTFLAPFLITLCADKTLIGLMASVNLVTAFPLLLTPNIIIKYLGSALSITLALAAYTIRFTAYVYISDARWSLLIECLRTYCIHLPWLAALHHIAKIAPDQMNDAAQVFVVFLHYHAGRGVGSLLGGFLITSAGFILTWMVSAVVAGLACCVYFGIHVFWFFETNFE